MKNLYMTLLCLYCILSSAEGQTVPFRDPDHNRPRLFQHLPDTIQVNFEELKTLLAGTVGQPVSMQLSNQVVFPFQGNVSSVSSKHGNTIQSVVIRSQNYSDANLTLTKVQWPDGSTSYQGRLMSFRHGDLFELRKRAGEYVWVKRGFYQVVNE